MANLPLPSAILVPTMLLAASLTTHAQWPTDPSDPLVICNDPSAQKNLRILGDGAGGWYLLWTDDRTAPNENAIYAQRVAPDGELLWETNGRTILHLPGRSINYLACARLDDGNMMLAYVTGPDHTTVDTLYTMAYDEDGAPVWTSATKLAHPGALPVGGTSSGPYGPQIVARSGAAMVAWATGVIGAVDYVTVSRVTNGGLLTIQVQGVFVPSLNNVFTGGPWVIRPDPTDGLMIERRLGNGSGAPLIAQRVNMNGAELWSGNLQVSANSSGLSYEWSTAIAPDGKVASVWAYGYDLNMAFYDEDGLMQSPSAPYPVAIHPDVQENPFVLPKDGKTFVAWADNRAAFGGQRQVYLQRFDALGQPELAENGVPAYLAYHNNVGYPRLVNSTDNTLITVMSTSGSWGGVTYGLKAQRIDHDGNALWSDTVRFCNMDLNPNGNTAFGAVGDGSGGAVAFWYNWEDDAIYAARIDSTGQLGGDGTTGTAELPRTALIQVHPNPAKDRLTVTFGGPLATGPASLELWDATGRCVMAVPVGALRTSHSLDLSAGYASGVYQIVLRSEGAMLGTARVALER